MFRIGSGVRRVLGGEKVEVVEVIGTAMALSLGLEKTDTAHYEEGVPIIVRQEVEEYHRGDVVVLETPEEACSGPERVDTPLMVRRIVALGGDTLASQSGGTPYTLPAETVWVQADPCDTPQRWKDSSSFGPVPLSNLTGRAVFVLPDLAVANSDAAQHADASVVTACQN